MYLVVCFNLRVVLLKQYSINKLQVESDDLQNVIIRLKESIIEDIYDHAPAAYQMGIAFVSDDRYFIKKNTRKCQKHRTVHMEGA